MRLLADENVYFSTVRHLKELGHNVEDVRGMGLAGSTDDEVMEAAKRTKRVLLTRDKDFADVRYLSEKTPGIIVLRVRPPTPANVNRSLGKLLDKIKANQLKDTIVILEEDRYRIRRLR